MFHFNTTNTATTTPSPPVPFPLPHTLAKWCYWLVSTPVLITPCHINAIRETWPILSSEHIFLFHFDALQTRDVSHLIVYYTLYMIPHIAYILYTHFVNLIKIGEISVVRCYSLFVRSVICSLFHQFVEKMLAFSMMIWLHHYVSPLFFVLFCFSFIHYRLFCFGFSVGCCWKVNPLENVRRGSRTNEQTDKPQRKEKEEKKMTEKKVKHFTWVRFSSDICPRICSSTRAHIIGSNSMCVYVNWVTLHCHWHGTYWFLTIHM